MPRHSLHAMQHISRTLTARSLNTFGSVGGSSLLRHALMADCRLSTNFATVVYTNRATHCLLTAAPRHRIGPIRRDPTFMTRTDVIRSHCCILQQGNCGTMHAYWLGYRSTMQSRGVVVISALAHVLHQFDMGLDPNRRTRTYGEPANTWILLLLVNAGDAVDHY